MNLILAGISHRTAPVEVRERISIQESRLAATVLELVRRQGILEAMILSTCNRVEVVCMAEEGVEVEGIIQGFLADIHHCDLSAYERHFYWYRQNQAVRHLFRVAASLDSMIVGEPQILGQLRRACMTARQAGALNGPLHAIVNQALAVGRKVRRETAIGTAAVSVSYAAVELAKKIFGSLNGKTILVVGAGKMSEIATKHLVRSGASAIFVSNRTHERAEELAEAFHGVAVPFEQLFEYLAKADIVISSTGSADFVVLKADAEKLLAARRNRPIFFVDIAVPRDIDPAVNEVDNAFVYDIDDLEQVIEANRKQRAREAVFAEAIVDREVETMMRRLASRDIAPTIVALEDRLNRIRESEMERERGRLSTLTTEQREAVEALTRRMVNKILHGPITELKSGAGRPEQTALEQLIRKIFGLGH